LIVPDKGFPLPVSIAFPFFNEQVKPYNWHNRYSEKFVKGLFQGVNKGQGKASRQGVKGQGKARRQALTVQGVKLSRFDRKSKQGKARRQGLNRQGLSKGLQGVNKASRRQGMLAHASPPRLSPRIWYHVACV
jgi:hypothetical protein